MHYMYIALPLMFVISCVCIVDIRYLKYAFGRREMGMNEGLCKYASTFTGISRVIGW